LIYIHDFAFTADGNPSVNNKAIYVKAEDRKALNDLTSKLCSEILKLKFTNFDSFTTIGKPTIIKCLVDIFSEIEDTTTKSDESQTMILYAKDVPDVRIYECIKQEASIHQVPLVLEIRNNNIYVDRCDFMYLRSIVHNILCELNYYNRSTSTYYMPCDSLKAKIKTYLNSLWY